MGKLRLMTIIGTRPEIIRLSAVIKCCDRYFEQTLVHTGQNYDYTLNQVFFDDLGLRAPDYYLDAAGDDLGATIGNIIDRSYKLMARLRPDAVLVLGDTNSCLSVIGAKRLHIPIFHMEAGNRCKDECLPEETNRRIVDIISDVNLCYSEHARRYLMECGMPKERTFVVGSPMAEVLRASLEKIKASDVHARLGLTRGRYILLSAHREENIDTDCNFIQLFTAVNAMAETYNMPILYSCHPRSRKRLEATGIAEGAALNEMLLAHDTASVKGSARLSDLIRRPQIGYRDLAPFDPEHPALSPAVQEAVEIQMKYAGYIERQQRQVAELSREENRLLPDGIDYLSITGLRVEARQKLQEIRPLSIGQAGRISGVSPSDIAVLLIWLSQHEKGE